MGLACGVQGFRVYGVGVAALSPGLRLGLGFQVVSCMGPSVRWRVVLESLQFQLLGVIAIMRRRSPSLMAISKGPVIT